MQGFVNQAHGVKGTSMDGAFRMTLHVAGLVNAVREVPAGGKVGQDHVPGQREQDFVNRVAVARLPGYVELEHGYPLSLF